MLLFASGCQAGVITINSPASVEIGDDFYVTVEFDSEGELYDAWMIYYLNFSHVEITDVVLNEYWDTQYSYEGDIFSNSLHETQAFNTSPKNGTSQLVTIHFKALSSGTCDFVMKDFKYAYGGNEHYATINGDSTTVGSGDNPVPPPPPPPPPSNDAPVANAGFPIGNIVDEEVCFDASNSTDDKGIVEYRWDLGDGYIVYGKEACHTYTNCDNYTVTLTVFDEEGLSDSDSITVFVVEYDAPPDDNPDENPDDNPDDNPDENPDDNPDENLDDNPDDNPDTSNEEVYNYGLYTIIGGVAVIFVAIIIAYIYRLRK